MTMITTTIKVSDILSVFYIGLTLAKLIQWLVVQYKNQKSTNNNNNVKMELNATTMVWILLLDLIISTNPDHGMVGAQKIPRKHFRVITDGWTEGYNKTYSKRQPPKKFTSMRGATRSFYKEFVNESSSFLVDFSAATWVPFFRQPLGIMSCVSLSIFILLTPILILREFVWMGGNQLSYLCKAAASSTIVDLYVVSCKENLSYNESLFRYGWVADAFTRKQPHPMIGKAVCPMYKRTVYFPKDIMDFEYKAISTKVGVLLLKETSATKTTTTTTTTTKQRAICRLLKMLLFGFDDNNEDNELLPCHLIYLCLILMLINTEGLLSGILEVSKFAIPFYFTRTIVDRSLGIEWLAPTLP